MQPRDGLVPEQSPDALDRLEVLPVANGPDPAAVEERLVDSEVEPVARSFHARPVEGARASLDGNAAAARAAKRGVVDSVLEEQEVDPRV